MKYVQMLDTASCPDASVLADVKSNAILVYIGGAGSAGSGWTPEVVKNDLNGWLPCYVPAQESDSDSAARATKDITDILSILANYPTCRTVLIDLENGTVAADPVYWASYIENITRLAHPRSYELGVYSSLSEVAVFAGIATPPDFVVVASWSHNTQIDSLDPHDIPGFPSGLWKTQGQRGWQYASNVSIAGWNWDCSAIDAELVNYPEPAPVQAPSPAPEAAPETTPPPPETTPPPELSSTYTVVPGDTLWGLAMKFDTTTQELYLKNADVLDSTARLHGFPSSREGALIWPGTTLEV